MPLLREIGEDWRERVNTLSPSDDGAAYIYLAKIIMSATEEIYLASNAEDVTFLGKTWQAFPFVVGNESAEGSGEQTTARIVVSDPSGQIQRLVKQLDGLTGKDVVLYYVNTALLATPTDGAGEANYLSSEYRVDAASFDANTVQLRISSKPLLNIAAPALRLLRDSCPFVYKGAECGYVGELLTCDKSYDGLNGCRAHANEDRFGGAPGIPIL